MSRDNAYYQFYKNAPAITIYLKNKDIKDDYFCLSAIRKKCWDGWMDGWDGMVFIGHMSSESTWGILVKLVICVVPGHWKIKILNLKKRNKFICFFMFLYPIQGGKNIGSPYLTNKSWFFGKSDVPGQQNKSYIGVMASKNLIFLMFWLSFVYL